MARQRIKSDIPFYQEQYEREMDKTVKEAKGEVEGFIQNKFIKLGIEGLKAEQLLITDEKK